MKINAIFLVKNEIDILEEVLNHVSEWADKIYIADNGSDDGTWEKAIELAKKNRKIILWGRIFINFHQGLRLNIWESIRNDVEEGDWWCVMDADEFYYDNPREFLSKIPKHYGVVSTKTIEFVPLKSQKSEFEKLEKFQPDFFKKYIPLDWSETRFFRETKKSRYRDRNTKVPLNCLATYPERIRVLHYPLRTAKQVQKRLDVRNNARKNGCESFTHIKEHNWIEKLYNDNEPILKDIQKDGLVWNEYARNFNSKSLNYILRTNIKILMYYMGIL